MELDKCHYCNGSIRWVETVNGKPMPLDPDPTPAGNVVFTHEQQEAGQVRVLTKDELAGPARRYRYTAHFASCSYSRRAAKGVAPAARARTQELFDQETRRRGEPNS